MVGIRQTSPINDKMSNIIEEVKEEDMKSAKSASKFSNL